MATELRNTLNPFFMAAAKTLDCEHTTTLWTGKFWSSHRIVRSEYSPDSMTLTEISSIFSQTGPRHTSAYRPLGSEKCPLTTMSNGRKGLDSQPLALDGAWEANLLATALVASPPEKPFPKPLWDDRALGYGAPGRMDPVCMSFPG